MARHRNETIDPERSLVLQVFRRLVPVTDTYHGQKFLVRQAGRWMATPLLAVLVLVEVTDIVFAILGLRAMYFLLADLMHRFVYLKLGPRAGLGWGDDAAAGLYKILTGLSLAVVAVILTVAVTASWLRTPHHCGPSPWRDGSGQQRRPG